MQHGLCVAPLFRILPSPPPFRISITYMPALGLPIRLRLRLISSARSHSFPTAHLVAYPFQGSFRPRMDQMDSSRRTRSTTGCSSLVTTSNRDPVEGSGRGLHLAAYARSAGKAKRGEERLTPTQYLERKKAAGGVKVVVLLLGHRGVTRPDSWLALLDACPAAALPVGACGGRVARAIRALEVPP